jgi:hypothetical protein
LRAILGNDVASNAYREGKLPFPDGTIIARLASSYVPSEENSKVFGRLAVPNLSWPGAPRTGFPFSLSMVLPLFQALRIQKRFLKPFDTSSAETRGNPARILARCKKVNNPTGDEHPTFPSSRMIPFLLNLDACNSEQ